MIEEKKCTLTGRVYKIYAPGDLSKSWFVHYKDDNGKRQRKYGEVNRIDDPDKRLAALEALRDELMEQFRHGIPDTSGPTLESRMFQWMEAQPWRPKTLGTYRSIVNAFLDHLAGRDPSREICLQFMAHVRKTRYETTYNKYLHKLRHVLESIGESGHLEGLKKVRERRRPARWFESHQIERLKQHIEEKQPDLWLFVQFIYYTLIRPRELRKLRAGNIMLESAKVYIPGEISKNGKSEYVAIQDAFIPKLRFVKRLAPNDLLFPSPYDASKPIGENTMWNRHHKILKALGFGKGYTLYGWKHTGAVHFILAGGSAVALQRQLRHHSLDQVQDYLAELGVDDLEEIRTLWPTL